MAKELPGDVLRDLRERHHKSRPVFGDMVEWGKNIQRALEDHRTAFTDDHLDTLIDKLGDVGWIKPGDESYVRFKDAMDYAWELEEAKRNAEAKESAETSSAAKPGAQEPNAWQPGDSGAGKAPPPMIVPRPQQSGDNQFPRWLQIVGGVLLLALMAYGGYSLGRGVQGGVGGEETPLVAEVGGPPAGTSQPGTAQPEVTSSIVMPPTYTPYPTYTALPTDTPSPPATATSYPTYTPYPTYTTIPASPTSAALFADDFDTGIKPDWQKVSGDWRFMNSMLTTLSRDDESSLVLVGDPSWTDYSIDLVIDADSGAYLESYVDVIAHAQDASNYVFYRVHSSGISKSRLGWWIMKNGETTRLTYDNILANDLRARVEVRGDIYTAYLDDEKMSSIQEPSFGAGRVGIRLHCFGERCCNIDDFQVRALP